MVTTTVEPPDAPVRPDPSAALAQAYETIRRTRMEGIPILNGALGVETVGFRRWQGFWLGVLVTPWCMNLVLTEADPTQWPRLRIGEKAAHFFPAGRFDFIFGREALLGDGRHAETLMCSLFSPMFEFADQAGAQATALACLTALFDKGNVEATDIAIGPVPVTLQQDAAATAEKLEREEAEIERSGEAAATDVAVSKRDFLRGRWSGREPKAPDAAADRT
jgi:[NiFe] hydrogenase assembly HybE family chaperone